MRPVWVSHTNPQQEGFMPARKSSTSTSKAPRASKKSVSSKGGSGPVPPYGDPIRHAIASGDLQEMRRVAASTRRFLKDIEKLLARLDKQIYELSGK
jgi:hypothetical protein